MGVGTGEIYTSGLPGGADRPGLGPHQFEAIAFDLTRGSPRDAVSGLPTACAPCRSEPYLSEPYGPYGNSAVATGCLRSESAATRMPASLTA